MGRVEFAGTPSCQPPANTAAAFVVTHLQGLICRVVVKLLYISRHHKREPNFYLEFHHDHRTSEILQSVLSSCARQNTSHRPEILLHNAHAVAT